MNRIKHLSYKLMAVVLGIVFSFSSLVEKIFHGDRHQFKPTGKQVRYNIVHVFDREGQVLFNALLESKTDEPDNKMS